MESGTVPVLVAEDLWMVEPYRSGELHLEAGSRIAHETSRGRTTRYGRQNHDQMPTSFIQEVYMLALRPSLTDSHTPQTQTHTLTPLYFPVLPFRGRREEEWSRSIFCTEEIHKLYHLPLNMGIDDVMSLHEHQ